MLHKALESSIRDVDQLQGIVTGYASAFNIIDDDQDIVLPGAFTKTLAEQGPQSKQPRIKFLYQHDATKILGVPSVLKEDHYGLYFEVKLADTPLARDVAILYAEGVLTEHSIGYEVVESSWDRGQQARLLKQLKLYEFSVVTWGANSQTPVISIKSLAQPASLTTLANRAARIDHLLHHGTLHSDTLCETLDRELKSLHAALAPTAAPDRPYTIQGVLDSMNDLVSRLQAKGASGKTTWPLGERDAAWDGGAAHKRIVAWATKDNGDVDVAKLKSVHFYSPDGDDAQDVSKYKLLFCDRDGDAIKAMPRAIFACAGSHGVDATTGISDSDKATIKGKIETYYAAMRKKFDDPDITVPWADDEKGATMGKRLVKSADGDVEVSEDGTHGAFTGTHTHAHKAMGSQGDDATHEHEHSHDGDGDHGHTHGKASGHQHSHKQQPRRQMQKAPNGRQIRKARDFGTLFASLNESDQLQDDWGDTFIAFVQCMEELMWQSCLQNGGYMPDGAEDVDIEAAAKSNVDAFGNAVMALVQRSAAADFVPQLDWDGDQFLDPDGVNAHEGYDSDSDYDDYKSRRQPQRMPDAPAPLRKAGRSISEGNRKVITDALDGMSEAMKAMKAHHGTIADLMTKTDPDHTRQDEDDTQGDDDTENGGTNPNKSRNRPAPERHKAATTHGFDLSALDTTLDALRSRASSGREAR